MSKGACPAAGIEVIVLVDNTSPRENLSPEHGLSFWIRDRETCVLMDTGQGGALPANAVQLGVDLRVAESVILSHGHFDHTGGVEHVFSLGMSPRIFMHPDAVIMRYGCLQAPPHKSIGMHNDIVALLSDRVESIVLTTGPTQVSEHIWVTGPIPRQTAFEDTGGPFYVDAECLVPDEIVDDQAVWLETEKGLVVLFGCAHSGVVNTLDHISKLSGAAQFHAVIGGMHLLNASAERLDATVDALRNCGVEWVAPCHCTGEAPISLLAQQFPAQFVRVGVGSTFQF